jgi:hypothetical protein
LDDGDVERNGAVAKQIRNVGQKHRNEIGATVGHRDPCFGTAEERHRANASRGCRAQKARRAGGVQAVETNALDVGARRKRVEKRNRRRRSAVNEASRAAFDATDYAGRVERASAPIRIDLHDTPILPEPTDG